MSKLRVGKILTAMPERKDKPLDFRDPEDVLRECDEERRTIPKGRFIRDPRYRPLQEKWCAAMFGVGYRRYVRPCRIALNESRDLMDADFFLQAGEVVFPFQTTERLRAERRRDDEYRELEAVEDAIAREPEREEELTPRLLTEYRPGLGTEEGPEWIAAAIAKKVRKRYAESRSLNLLVYANFEAKALSIDALRERARENRDSFASVWIITDFHICALFSNDRIGTVPGGEWGHIWPDIS